MLLFIKCAFLTFFPPLEIMVLASFYVCIMQYYKHGLGLLNNNIRNEGKKYVTWQKLYT